MISPGNNVIPCDNDSIICGILKIIALVRPSCFKIPFNHNLTERSVASKSDAGTIHGPIGQEESKDFPLYH